MNKKTQTTHVGYVALIGRPNAGKSTLLNTILGQKIAIISDKPQTTRTSILGIKTSDTGQIIFIDNPGVHKPLHRLNRRMMNFVYSSLETADLICLIVDASLKYGHGDQFVIDTLKSVSTPILLLLNKVDISKKNKLLLLIDHYKDLLPFAEIIPLSARTGVNVDVLEQQIFKYLPLAEKLYSDEDISDQSQTFLLSEIIREKLLAEVEQELPFTTAVYIEHIGDRQSSEDEEQDQKRASKFIKASILVEKDNHRKMIIGRGGSRIKTIGMAARKEIEEILESHVYLDLHVKVQEGWRDAPNVLDLIEQQ